MSGSNINSLSHFQSHRYALMMLFFDPKKLEAGEGVYICGTIIVSLLFSLGFPLHLGMKLFRNETRNQNMLNLGTFLPCLGASSKFIIYALNFGKVRRMEELLRLLDQRVSGHKQRSIYAQVRTRLRVMVGLFIGIYAPCGITAVMMFLFAEERSLMYYAWFPFDWKSSFVSYCLANGYQSAGISYQLVQNYVNDCFPALVLCLVAAHAKILYCRLEEIGENPLQNAERELEKCITDHKNLLELFRITEAFMSFPMAIQFLCSAVNSCLGIASFLFSTDEPMVRAYSLCYTLAMILQIFPCCYFGTESEFWFGRLHYAAFSCNWLIQERSFKRKLMLFVERSLKSSTAMACGMVSVSLMTFFATLKFAYSLFTIILRID
ncbi:odorant receptor 59a-like [Drosophila kikkawai]|uniref:Odorant receptor n=1 Tax=Drosophila kikkawai TaxID=30033 RepID=A0A6P4ING8_DROKI